MQFRTNVGSLLKRLKIISKSDVKLKHMEYNYFFFVVLAIKNGREISRFTGAADENRIQKMIDQLSR